MPRKSCGIDVGITVTFSFTMMSKHTRCPAVTPWKVSRKPSPLLSMAGSGSQPRAASPAVFASMWSTTISPTGQ